MRPHHWLAFLRAHGSASPVDVNLQDIVERCELCFEQPPAEEEESQIVYLLCLLPDAERRAGLLRKYLRAAPKLHAAAAEYLESNKDETVRRVCDSRN